MRHNPPGHPASVCQSTQCKLSRPVTKMENGQWKGATGRPGPSSHSTSSADERKTNSPLRKKEGLDFIINFPPFRHRPRRPNTRIKTCNSRDGNEEPMQVTDNKKPKTINCKQEAPIINNPISTPPPTVVSRIISHTDLIQGSNLTRANHLLISMAFCIGYPCSPGPLLSNIPSTSGSNAPVIEKRKRLTRSHSLKKPNHICNNI